MEVGSPSFCLDHLCVCMILYDCCFVAACVCFAPPPVRIRFVYYKSYMYPLFANISRSRLSAGVFGSPVGAVRKGRLKRLTVHVLPSVHDFVVVVVVFCYGAPQKGIPALQGLGTNLGQGCHD